MSIDFPVPREKCKPSITRQHNDHPMWRGTANRIILNFPVNPLRFGIDRKRDTIGKIIGINVNIHGETEVVGLGHLDTEEYEGRAPLARVSVTENVQGHH